MKEKEKKDMPKMPKVAKQDMTMQKKALQKKMK